MDSGIRARLVLFTRYELDLAAARYALAAQPGQTGALSY